MDGCNTSPFIPNAGKLLMSLSFMTNDLTGISRHFRDNGVGKNSTLWGSLCYVHVWLFVFVCVKTKWCTKPSPLGADQGLCSAGGWFLSSAEFHSIHSRTTEIIGADTNLPQLLRVFISEQEPTFSQVTKNPAEAKTVQHECSHLTTYASRLMEG